MSYTGSGGVVLGLTTTAGATKLLSDTGTRAVGIVSVIAALALIAAVILARKSSAAAKKSK